MKFKNQNYSNKISKKWYKYFDQTLWKSKKIIILYIFVYLNNIIYFLMVLLDLMDRNTCLCVLKNRGVWFYKFWFINVIYNLFILIYRFSTFVICKEELILQVHSSKFLYYQWPISIYLYSYFWLHSDKLLNLLVSMFFLPIPHILTYLILKTSKNND